MPLFITVHTGTYFYIVVMPHARLTLHNTVQYSLRQHLSLVITLKNSRHTISFKHSQLCSRLQEGWGHPSHLYVYLYPSCFCHETSQNPSREWQPGTYLRISLAYRTPHTCQAMDGSGRYTCGIARTLADAVQYRYCCKSCLSRLPLQRALHVLVKK